MEVLATWSIGIAACVAVILFHHGVLLMIGAHLLPRFDRPRPRYVAAIVLVLFAAHVVESQAYGIALYIAAERFDLGRLAGGSRGGIVEYLYFSLVSYTSLGFGDVLPMGHLRLLAGLEALLGLLLIGWSASFLFARVEELRR